MDTSHPIGVDDDKHVPGTGFVLPGKKTYLAAAAAFLYGAILAYANKHQATGIVDWLAANKDTVELWLVAALGAAGRAAIAKVQDTLAARLRPQAPP